MFLNSSVFILFKMAGVGLGGTVPFSQSPRCFHCYRVVIHKFPHGLKLVAPTLIFERLYRFWFVGYFEPRANRIRCIKQKAQFLQQLKKAY